MGHWITTKILSKATEPAQLAELVGFLPRLLIAPELLPTPQVTWQSVQYCQIIQELDRNYQYTYTNYRYIIMFMFFT